MKMIAILAAVVAVMAVGFTNCSNYSFSGNGESGPVSSASSGAGSDLADPATGAPATTVPNVPATMLGGESSGGYSNGVVASGASIVSPVTGERIFFDYYRAKADYKEPAMMMATVPSGTGTVNLSDLGAYAYTQLRITKWQATLPSEMAGLTDATYRPSTAINSTYGYDPRLQATPMMDQDFDVTVNVTAAGTTTTFGARAGGQIDLVKVGAIGLQSQAGAILHSMIRARDPNRPENEISDLTAKVILTDPP